MAFGISAGTLLSGAASIGSALISENSADSALGAQTQANDKAEARLTKQYDTTRTDLAPWREGGGAAQNALLYRLGIGGTPNGSASSAPTAEQLRQKYLQQFTTAGTPEGWQMGRVPGGSIDEIRPIYQPAQEAKVDEAGLQAAIDRELSSYQSQPAQQTANPNDPTAGSLLKPFTGADLQNEPGYQFGQQQGQQAIDRGQAARGNYLSGAAMKALARFNSDYASTKYGEAFNRDEATKDRTFNYLDSTSRSGQAAAAGTAAAGQNINSQLAQNDTALGNAAGAASIATGNAFGGALNGINQQYQQNALIDKIRGGNVGWNSSLPTSNINSYES